MSCHDPTCPSCEFNELLDKWEQQGATEDMIIDMVMSNIEDRFSDRVTVNVESALESDLAPPASRTIH